MTTDFTKQKVSIQEYLEYQGHSWGKVNNGGYAKVDGHDSLFVNLEQNTFTWFARDVGGGIFKLMKELDDIENYEDQKSLLTNIREERESEYENYVPVREQRNSHFKIENHNLSPLSDKSIQYLTKVRGIHPNIVASLSKSGFLQDENKALQSKSGKTYQVSNLWYAWRSEEGKIVGADVQATHVSKNKVNDNKHQGYWKGVVVGSPASRYGFNFQVGPHKDIPDRLIIVEAPVDAISYWQLHFSEIRKSKDNVAFLSLSGVKESVLTSYIKQRFINEDQGLINLPREFHFAVDNDEAGRGLIQKYGNMLRNFGPFDQVDLMVDVPADLTVKDWNDQLRFGHTYATRSVKFEALDTLPMFSKQNLDNTPKNNIEKKTILDNDEGQVPSQEQIDNLAKKFNQKQSSHQHERYVASDLEPDPSVDVEQRNDNEFLI
jgi:hypothetical protein